MDHDDPTNVYFEAIMSTEGFHPDEFNMQPEPEPEPAPLQLLQVRCPCGFEMTGYNGDDLNHGLQVHVCPARPSVLTRLVRLMTLETAVVTGAVGWAVATIIDAVTR